MPELVSDKCRLCGIEGLADSELDPAPGMCPKCLGKGLKELMSKVFDVTINSGSDVAELTLSIGLHNLGMTDYWVDRFMARDTDTVECAMNELRRRWHSQ